MFRRYTDSVYRRLDAATLEIRKLLNRNNQTKLSDSQTTNYEIAVLKALKSSHYFANFRKKYRYRIVLEHVPPSTGQGYLERIEELEPGASSNLLRFKSNDKIGNPAKHKFGMLGEISPTTLRYVAVAYEMKKIFGPLDGFDIAEIGIGYGGQIRVLDEMFEINNFYGFDLPSVQSLALKYLANFDLKTRIHMPKEINPGQFKYDLAISNYAFSELPRELQAEYLNRVLTRSRNGYMIMNSGRTNLTGRSDGKYALDELLASIPNSQICEEVPSTDRDNYVIYWKDE
jgi:putative sugar O-methyltransferase